MFGDDVFLADGFDADRFVAERRKDLTLEGLHGELEAYVANLDNTLVSIINNDYSAFLKLSSMLVDIDALVAGLREPLNQLEDKVVDVKAVVGEPLGKQDELLERLVYVQEKRRVIKLFLSVRETLEKVEKQAEQLRKAGKRQGQAADSPTASSKHKESAEAIESPPVSPATHSPESAGNLFESRGEALGRATQRLARVSFLSQENGELPLLRSIRAKARTLEHAVLDELDRAFVEAVGGVSSNEEPVSSAARVKAVAVVLRAYVAVSKRDRAGQVFKERLVKPFLASLFVQGKVDAGGARGKASGLPAVYRQVLAFVQRRCRPLLEAVSDRSEGLGQVDFVGAGVCEGLAEAIEERLKFVYSSGSAETLHASYRQTDALFNVLGALAIDEDKVRTERARVLGLWNLAVYVSLCSQDLAKRLESALAREVKCRVERGTDRDPALDAARTLLECHRECWGDAVFLAPVSAKLLKVDLELFARFAGWAARAVKLVSEQFDLPVEPAVAQVLGTDDGIIDQAAIAAWPPGVACEDLLLAAADCALLAALLREESDRLQAKLFPSIGKDSSAKPLADGRAAVHNAIGGVASQLELVAAAAKATVQGSLANACVELLHNGLRSVAPMYRMTNKPAPTEASTYAGKVLEPLNAFMDGQQSSLVSGAERSDMGRRVLEHVLGAFEGGAAKVLEEVVSSENALRRLKRNTAARELDSDKIRTQFRLDLDLVLSQAAQIGAQVDAGTAGKLRLTFSVSAGAEK